MDRSALMVLVLVFLAMLLALMVLGWRARMHRQRAIATPDRAPESTGATIGSFAAKYVATTAAGNPLDRIAVHGLGFRGPASVVVAEDGVLLSIAGTQAKWIPVTDIKGLRRATWTIDRVVETDGLELLEWTLGGTDVDSYLRIDNAREFERAVQRLIGKEAA